VFASSGDDFASSGDDFASSGDDFASPGDDSNRLPQFRQNLDSPSVSAPQFPQLFMSVPS
jgi:hypothetical protein